MARYNPSMLPPRHQHQRRTALWSYWPRRILTERRVVFLLVCVAVALLVINGLAPDKTNTIRMQLYDRTSHLLAITSAPVQRVTQLIEHMTGLSDMATDLKVMREENARLRQWYERARQLEAENRSLRTLVNLADMPRARFVTARVIAESGSAFSQGVVVDAGKSRGVTDAMAAVTGKGVVGRVVAVASRTAQVILLNDVNARVPVMVENSRHRGVLAGDNTNQPRLLYLPEDAAVTKGDRILTSGHGGIYAAGLPVGIVDEITNGVIKVRPLADMRRLEHVQLIDFEQKKLLDMGAQNHGR